MIPRWYRRDSKTKDFQGGVSFGNPFRIGYIEKNMVWSILGHLELKNLLFPKSWLVFLPFFPHDAFGLPKYVACQECEKIPNVYYQHVVVRVIRIFVSNRLEILKIIVCHFFIIYLSFFYHLFFIFLTFIFHFFIMMSFSFFIISPHFLRFLHGFLVFCSFFDQKMRKI